MSYQDVQPPDLFPILSPGKHRSPRTGACFMELASLLAGERWSDHPACTHPLLTCERVLADLDGRAVGSLEEQSRLGDIPEVDGCAVRVIVRMRDCRSWRRWAVRGCQAWRAWPIPRHRRARDGGEKRRGHPRSARSRAATGQPASMPNAQNRSEARS